MEFIQNVTLLNPGKVIVIYGPPCAGKTTLSKILAEMYNIPRLSMDLIRKYYDKTELFTEANNAEVLDLFLKQLNFFNKKRLPVICEGLFHSNERQSKLLNSVQCGDVFFIYLAASLSTLHKRLEARNLTGLNSEGNSSDNLTHYQLDIFYNVSLPNKSTDLIIDTDIFNIEESIQQICKGLNEN